MSTSSKKPKSLSADSFSKMVTKHTTRAQTTEKASGTSKQTQASNTVLTKIDPHKVLSYDPNVVEEDNKLLFCNYSR